MSIKVTEIAYDNLSLALQHPNFLQSQSSNKAVSRPGRMFSVGIAFFLGTSNSTSVGQPLRFVHA